MDFFHFDHAAPQNIGTNPSSTTYDFNPISPTTPEADTMFTDHGMSSQLQGNADNMWEGPSHGVVDGGLEKLLHNYPISVDQYGQVTPPEDSDRQNMSDPMSKRADSGASGIDIKAVSSMSPRQSTSNKRPSVRSSEKSRRESRTMSGDVLPDDKKDKYREKNRVAAAKCRAKKKEHTDSLEDTYRTQSAMNTALKQTEKSLRDELSYWRTQALQHTFCACHTIQEYNLRKAQSMALGGNGSPTMANDRSSSFAHNHLRSSSVVEMASPVMSNTSRANSFGYGKISPTSFPAMPETDVKDMVEV
ncbi:hypothetical protein E4T39_04095 [Aureobasidium subglaciale]|nr:hypothetical protein E4T39_04095 [Aureobasidium subglaciale]